MKKTPEKALTPTNTSASKKENKRRISTKTLMKNV